MDDLMIGVLYSSPKLSLSLFQSVLKQRHSSGTPTTTPIKTTAPGGGIGGAGSTAMATSEAHGSYSKAPGFEREQQSVRIPSI